MGFDTRSQRKKRCSPILLGNTVSFPPKIVASSNFPKACNAYQMRLTPRLATLLLIAGVLMLQFTRPDAVGNASELWVAPLKTPTLVHEFRQPNSDWSAGHRGVDYLAAEGAPVIAPKDSVVSFDGKVVNRGVLSLKTSEGLILSLEPICSQLSVGQSIRTGEYLGNACYGTEYVSHCLPRLCLHFSMRNASGYLSPLVKIGGLSPSRLKPWGGLTCTRPSAAQC